MTIVISLAIYFFISCAVLAIVFLPGLRWRFFEQLSRVGVRLSRFQAFNRGLLSRGQQVNASIVSKGVVGPVAWLKTHWRAVLVALLFLVVVPLIAVSYRHLNRLETFDHTYAPTVDKQIMALLAGDRLVPPPPIPPERFATMLSVEVEIRRPLVRLANRQWDLLDADFSQRLLIVFQLMKERHGYDMILLEGYRSPARQEMLLAMGSSVTKAGANMSYHQFGLAGDCAFLLNGKIVISERDPWAMQGYQHFGVIAKEVGLVWGGSWKSIQDYGHVELRKPGVLGKGNGAADNADQKHAH
jgi:peptidoglycan LD-endopeptidase CwlK